MIKAIKHIYGLMTIAIALTIGLSSCNSTSMREEFLSPTEEVQTAVYWYWISGNISKEGVIADLHAMKQAGINRAFIGDIGQDGLYTERNVKIMSDEWWEVLHTALKTASELGIEIGIFNSPGWSQSGGPWVKPEEAMRYLAAEQFTVKGGEQVNRPIKPSHLKDFQHVRTIAFPSAKLSAATIEHITLNGKPSEIGELPSNQRNTLEIKLSEPEKLRSLLLHTSAPERPMLCNATLEAKVDGKWQQISKFEIDRSNQNLNVGFMPSAPICVAFECITTEELRLHFEPSSNAGGVKSLEFSPQPRIAYFAEKSLAKMCQTPLPYWDYYMWEEQPLLDDKSLAIDPETIIDLSQHIDQQGVLKWQAPAGDWSVIALGMTPTGVTNAPATPEATGLEIDKMSSKHIATHFDAYIGEILRRIPEKDRTTFKVVVQDSYETGGQNFTDKMMEDFESYFGYSMLPYLPVYYGYVVGDEQKSNRFLWDLRRFIADRVAYEYVGGLKRVSISHGLTTWLECYGHWGFPGEFLQYGGQSDEIAGEFWSVGSLGDIENRAASSCGHIYGKSRIWAESNTSGGPAYSRTPIDMKERTDRFFAEGINATLLHLYIEQADINRYPGINAWFGNEFDAHNTWYSHLDLFTYYTKRCNYMLQQGLNIADVAYLIGEDAPKMTGLQSPALPKGYQFDYINAEVLMLGANVVKNNIVLPHGTSYRVLVLPPIDNMRPELLKKIKRMVGDGAIVLGNPPTHSPSLQNYPEADKEVEQEARELWGECYDKRGCNKYGKGRIYNGYTLEELFADIDLVADCAIEKDAPLLYNHRSTVGAEIYFICNQSNAKHQSSVTFRVGRDMHPELWNPVDGSTRELPQYQTSDRGVTIPLEFDALESYFIVFDKNSKKDKTYAENFPKPQHSQPIEGEWELSFEGKLSQPAPIKMSKLEDLSQSQDEELRYFSGTINYQQSISLKQPPTSRVMLNMERVEAMAKVYVNGELAGGVWCKPYKVDITKHLREGENHLRIEVVNKWVNRIVGDMQLPAEQRKISLTANPYNASSPIPASGLIGEVRLEYYE